MRLWDYIEQGGSIMYILLFMNIFGLSLLLWRIFTLYKAKKNIIGLSSDILKNLDIPKNHPEASALIKDEISLFIHNYEFGLNSIKVIASIAPLLGLLGTVVGILSAFQVIAAKGMNDPSLFAGGISLALITTVGGLIVAIPHFVGQYVIVGMLDDLEMKLEKETLKAYSKKA